MVIEAMPLLIHFSDLIKKCIKKDLQFIIKHQLASYEMVALWTLTILLVIIFS